MLYRIFVKSSFYVAFTITSFSAFFQLLLVESLNFDILHFTFIISWGFYAISRTNFSELSKKNGLIFMFFALLFVISFYKAFVLHYKPMVLLILIGLFMVSFLYLFSFFSFNLRKIPFLKAFVIAFVISGLVFLVNFYHLTNLPTFFHHFPLFFSAFFYLLGIAILFDIKDIAVDLVARLKTFPNTFGVKISKTIVLICFIFSFVFFLYSTNPIQSIVYYSFIFSLVIATWLSFLITEKTKPYFYTIFLESALLFPIIIYSLLNI